MRVLVCYRYWTRTALVLVALLLTAIALAQATIVPAAPEIHVFNNIGMVPVEPAASVLGATCAIDTDSGLVTVTLGDKVFTCTLKSASAKAGETAVRLPMAPFNRAGVIYVPSQQLFEALGGKVSVDAQLMAVLVTLDGADSPVQFPYGIVVNPMQYRDSDIELYMSNFDGTGVQRLTYDTRSMSAPYVSADGSTLLYESNGSLIVRKLNSPKETVVVRGNTTDMMNANIVYYTPYGFSPDGTQVLFSKRSPTQNTPQASIIGVVGVDGSKPLELTTGDSPCFSPDGKKIAYMNMDMVGNAQTTINLIDAIGGQPVVLCQGYEALFSPNGRMIVVTQSLNGPGVLTMNMLNGYKIAHTYAPQPGMMNGAEMVSSISPDSKTILYLRDGTALMSMKPDRSDMKPLAMVNGGTRAYFTADGSSIIYMNNNKLYSVKADGTGSAPIPISFKVSAFCVSPDGKHVFFTTNPE